MKFQLESEYKPAGDQPEAIEQLCSALEAGVGVNSACHIFRKRSSASSVRP